MNRAFVEGNEMGAVMNADNIIKPAHRFLLFLALCAAGLAGNYFKFSLLNADFIFGSTFAMLALQLLGFGRGVVAAFVISSYTYLAWNHPYAVLTMTAEVAVVGWLVTHRKVDMVVADAVYWVAVGIPMGYLLFHFISHMPSSNAVFLMTKQAINGVANCVVARLIFTAYSVGMKAPQVSLREIVSNLLVFFALFTGLIMLIYGSTADFSETDSRIRESVKRDSRDAAQNVDRWLEDRENAVANLAQMAARATPEQMQVRLEQARISDKNFLRIALLNSGATAVAYSPLTDERGVPNIGKSFADRPYIPLLKQNLRPMLSEVIESRFGTPGPVVIMLAPITSGGQYEGYVAGVLNLDRIYSILEGSLASSRAHYTVLDRNHKVIVTNRKDQTLMAPFSPGNATQMNLGAGLSQWIPEMSPVTSTIELWGQSSYVVESSVGRLAEWKLIVEQPVANFQKMLYDRYSYRLCMLFIIVVALLALADFLSRRMVSSTEQLAVITLDLPEKLASHSLVAWPESAVREAQHLISNFRKMADSLLEKFAENRRMNESLERMVQDRTRELETSQEKLATAVEIARLGHWDYDVANDLFTFNDQFYRLFEVTATQVGGYTMGSAEYASRFVHPDDRAVVDKEIRKAIESSDPHYNRQLEHRIIYNGMVGHVIVRILVNKDAEGHTIRMYGVTQDISDRKKAEETQRLLATAIYQATEGVVITDTQGTIQYVNPAIEQITGYSAEDLIGNKPSIMKSGQHDSFFYGQLWKTIKAGGTWSGRFVNRNKSGRIYYEDATISPVKDEAGAILNFVAVKRDVTEHLELSKQLLQAQKMEAVGTLAGGVAHDFNNLLQVVMGYSELLLSQKQPTEAGHEQLRKINEAGKRGADLVKNLLMFSRKVEPHLVPINLNDEVAQIQKLLSRTIPKTITIKLRLSGDLALVKADISQMGQVLMNLAVNARDAMPDGGALTIETTNIELDEHYCAAHLEVNPGRYVLITVSDSGHGMDEETRSHIFEPFYTTKEAGKGTGLGLATVFGIVKQHRGHIACYSEVGHGSTFKIYLPATEQTLESEAGQNPTGVTGGTETILLVDDEEHLRDLGATILKSYGYETLTARNGREALDTYNRQKEKISLVILDLIMPEMDGMKCLAAILNINPQARILIASGHSESILAVDGSASKAKGFVEKPYEMRKLLRVVREILDAKG